MVEIEYLPYQKIIVHEIRRMELSEFLLLVASQAEAQKQGAMPAVDWVDGIAFVKGEFLPTPETVEENLKGRLHYAIVFFTETSYDQHKKVSVSGREILVRFNKADSNLNFVELVKFLKNFKP